MFWSYPYIFIINKHYPSPPQKKNKNKTNNNKKKNNKKQKKTNPNNIHNMYKHTQAGYKEPFRFMLHTKQK